MPGVDLRGSKWMSPWNSMKFQTNSSAEFFKWREDERSIRSFTLTGALLRKGRESKHTCGLQLLHVASTILVRQKRGKLWWTTNHKRHDGPQTACRAKTPTAWWTTNGPRLKDPMSHCWEFHEESTWDGPVDIEITWNYCNSGKVLAQ